MSRFELHETFDFLGFTHYWGKSLKGNQVVKKITKLVSGGQTGADIAALDVALRHDFPHGGWCPKGRKSLERPIPAHYQLTETPSDSYLQRTEWNC